MKYNLENKDQIFIHKVNNLLNNQEWNIIEIGDEEGEKLYININLSEGRQTQISAKKEEEEALYSLLQKYWEQSDQILDELQNKFTTREWAKIQNLTEFLRFKNNIFFLQVARLDYEKGQNNYESLQLLVDQNIFEMYSRLRKLMNCVISIK